MLGGPSDEVREAICPFPKAHSLWDAPPAPLPRGPALRTKRVGGRASTGSEHPVSPQPGHLLARHIQK